MRRLCVIVVFFSLSNISFSQAFADLKIIGEIPEADDPNLFQIQVGAFLNAQNARVFFDRLSRASFSPSFEEYGFFTRVVINGVKALDVPFHLLRIMDAGFYEVIIRFDPAYEPVIYPPAAVIAEAETALNADEAEAYEDVLPQAAESGVITADAPVEQRGETSNTTNVVILIVPPVLPAAAQTENGGTTEEAGEVFDEKTIAIGLGPELNMNSGANTGVGNLAVGAVVAVDINFGSFWAVGITGKFSHDLSSAWVIEGELFVRHYFPGVPPRQKERHSGFFAQAEGGFHLIAQDHAFMNEGERLFRAMAGLRIGYRFLLGSSRFFYVEPFARAGFPFAGGVGLIGGIRF
jgi:hypothetical protein